MTNQELLQVLADKVASGEIGRGEVIDRLSDRGSTLVEKARMTHFSLTKVFYVLGSLVALVGIIFFITQIWDDIGSGGRIFVTLGLGLILAAAGSGCSRGGQALRRRRERLAARTKSACPPVPE